MAPRELERLFQRVVDDLESLKIRYAVIGGFAVSARASPRLTADIDFSVLVDSEKHAESILQELIGRSYVPLQFLENRETKRLASARLGVTRQKDSDPRIDLLFHFSGIEREVVLEATEEMILGKRTRVATLPHLIAMKVLAQDDTRRPKDARDLVELLKKASQDDIQAARTAITLMVSRGFGADKDLVAAFDGLIARRKLERER